MTNCWDSDPSQRPSFTKIVGLLAEMYTKEKSLKTSEKKTGPLECTSIDFKESKNSSGDRSTPNSQKISLLQNAKSNT